MRLLKSFLRLLFLFSVILFSPSLLRAQESNTLGYFIETAQTNSPILNDYNNQVISNRIDSLRLRASYGFIFTGEGDGMYAPIVHGWGYDEVITNGQSFFAGARVTKQIIGNKNLKARLALQSKPSNHPVGREYFFVKTNNKIVRVSFQDVLFIESLANYVVIHTIDQKIVAYLTTAGIESQLPPELFVRIHKSFIVAYHAILSIKNDEVITEKQALPIGKNQYSVLMEKIKSRLYKR